MKSSRCGEPAPTPTTVKGVCSQMWWTASILDKLLINHHFFRSVNHYTCLPVSRGSSPEELFPPKGRNASACARKPATHTDNLLQDDCAAPGGLLAPPAPSTSLTSGGHIWLWCLLHKIRLCVPAGGRNLVCVCVCMYLLCSWIRSHCQSWLQGVFHHISKRESRLCSQTWRTEDQSARPPSAGAAPALITWFSVCVCVCVCVTVQRSVGGAKTSGVGQVHGVNGGVEDVGQNLHKTHKSHDLHAALEMCWLDRNEPRLSLHLNEEERCKCKTKTASPTGRGDTRDVSLKAGVMDDWLAGCLCWTRLLLSPARVFLWLETDTRVLVRYVC